MQKRFFVLVFALAVSLAFKSQTNVITFNYDAGGNMSQRYLQVIPLFGSKLSMDKDSTTKLVFNVFPNPSTNIVNIEGELPESEKSVVIIITGADGKVVRRENYAGKRKSLDLTDLSSGIYLLNISGTKKLAEYKIILNK